MYSLIIYLLLVLLGLVNMSLATWRLSRMAMYDFGPNDIFLKIRNYLGVQEDYDGDEKLGFFHELLTCIYCTSIWAAGFNLLLSLTGVGSLVVVVLAASGKAIIVEENL